MPFPISDLNMGGTFAFIVTLDNQLRVYRVATIYGRLFYVEDLGIFLLDEDYRYIWSNGKSEIYIFNQKGANAISLRALHDIQKALGREGRKELDISDLALYVDKIRKVEVEKQFIRKLQTDPNNKLTDRDLLDMINDGSLEFTVNKLAELAKPRGDMVKGLALNDHAIAWLNSYFKEDVISRYYLLMREITDDKYKLKESKQVKGAFSFMSAAANKKNIALIVINNSRIDVDVKVKVEMNYDKGFYEITTRDYGTFEIREANTRLRFRRQSVFIVMVDSAARPAPRIEKESKTVLEIPSKAERSAELSQKITAASDQVARELAPLQEVKRSRGRPRKIGTVPLTNTAPVIEQGGPVQ